MRGIHRGKCTSYPHIIEHSDYDTVTLLTCESWNAAAVAVFARRVIAAVLVDITTK